MLTVKKVNLNIGMSQETLCFSADIYENGKLLAHAENRGCGGNTSIHPAKGLKYADVKHLDSIDNECLIMELVEQSNIIKTNQSKGFVLKKGEQYSVAPFPMSITKLKKNNNYKEYVDKGIANYEKDGYTVLNTNL